MDRREVNPLTKEEVSVYAVAVLEKELNCSVKKIGYVGGGSFGYVYKAQINKEPETLIIKACRTDCMCKREAKELAVLSDGSDIKMPKVYFTFLKNEEIPIDFICMEFIQGTDCFTDFKKLFKSRKRKEEFADKVTSNMNIWHSRTNDKFGPIENPCYDTWLEFYKPFAEDILNTARELRKERKIKKFVVDTMEKAWTAFPYIFSEEVKTASLIHGDLNVMNIMSDKDLNPTAIIDPLESRWADKEYDIFQLRNMTGNCFGLYEMYKSKYPVSEKCDIKTAFYALYNEIYCYIISGTVFYPILIPLVVRMKKELRKAGFKS